MELTGVIPMNCPSCRRPPQRVSAGAGIASGLPAGSSVLACRNCQQFTVEGVGGPWLPGGHGLHEALAAMAQKSPAYQAAEKQRLEKEELMRHLIETNPLDERLWN
jgi:hypothetical protein